MKIKETLKQITNFFLRQLENQGFQDFPISRIFQDPAKIDLKPPLIL